MNTALGDVHNLCWKLALVVKGIADPGLLDTYEVERLPVIRFNVEQSVRNARRMEAAGLGGIMKTQADFREEDIARMREAIPNQREHFEYHGQTFGYAYRSRLIFDEGNDAAPKDINTYAASAAPGGRAPHCWLKLPEAGPTVSTIDLFKDTRFTLLAGRHAQPWVAAFTRAAAQAGLRFQALRIGAGIQPIGVSLARLPPLARSTIHLSTRMFSEKPGHMNLPSLSLRNQFTWKMRGVSERLRCMLIQCRK